MRVLRGCAALSLAFVLGACQQTGLDYEAAPLNTENQQASYSIGLDYGAQLSLASNRIELEALVRGIRDGMEERDAALTPEERQTVMQSFSTAVQADIAAAREEEGAANRAEGETYLATNGAREGVMTTESGLQYEVITAADGASPAATDNVTIHYTGTLIDGTEFDSSRGGPPATFNASGVIPGFSEALQLMQVGSTYRIVIPSALGYGAQGSGGSIGPDATLIFELELIAIEATDNG